jgi:hypothetical protein
MNRLFPIAGLLFILTVSRAWGSTAALPAACNGFLNKTITNEENLWNSPRQAKANTWRRCDAILKANQDAQLKAIKAKRQAWINSQNQQQ